jgi:hypothetical protein
LVLGQALHAPADAPTTASLMGYQVMVKPGKAAKDIVMKWLNAERGSMFTDRDNRCSERYLAGKSTTKSGILTRG